MKATMQTSVKFLLYVKKGNELGDGDIDTFHDNIANSLFWLLWGLDAILDVTRHDLAIETCFF